MIDNVRMTAVVPVAGSSTGKTEGRRASAATPADASPASSASLSRLLTLAAELNKAGPPIDYARIAQVRRAIADGSYKVDPDVLAKAIAAYVAPA